MARLRVLGNAVVPQCAEAIGRMILERTMMIRLALLLLALTAAACSGNDYLQRAVIVEGDATAAERADVASAVARWNEVGGGRVQLAVDGQMARAIHVTFVEDMGTIDGNTYCGPSVMECHVTMARHAPFLEKKIEHELGHALGLPHDTSGPNIMFPRVDEASPRAVRLDAKEACRIWAEDDSCEW